ncbi:HAD family hydrolase [Streptomyces sp. NPDC102406]|uniref:HAD family hydrolase n=1 Tax=Streptomyces sp. NPDC102406 TaxID=3366171 RepID=UPI00380DA97D
MTSDATTSDAVTPATAKLVRGAHHVLLDFDGPICRLFAGLDEPVKAQWEEEWLEARRLGGALCADEREGQGPQPDRALVRDLEKRLTEKELQAVPTAWPTPWADPLILTWHAVGARLAVTTNNSPEAARQYIDSRGLSGCFEQHIYGRTQDLSLLKPHPHRLRQALAAMGAAPGDALMIGDAPSDHAAAHAAGVPFLGYARNDEKEARLRAVGAAHVVRTLAPVLEIVRSLPGRDSSGPGR